ncbi:polysaccharide deacetylase family protein [Chengkuizengella axinellae]|uniref:Polysaccharide deacetylase family protein n=1 Tax=Chengkuizengella axinellae TaxID=3064388 RepID=A0ABT9IYT8_9BACL|nr:polysaccharide deacetylase family protein [Chengkuizengella sp. 2205SS18-9]MDP5274393.1 polysaccharide deacetylase family protein [Chengkuizengella sp. 2205SS18-9]
MNKFTKKWVANIFIIWGLSILICIYPNQLMIEASEQSTAKDGEHPTLFTYPLQKQYPETVAYFGTDSKNEIVLTFDDGPDEKFTPQILDVLKKHNVKATFFLLGKQAEKHPQIVKRIQKEGHNIGNHTYKHSNLHIKGNKKFQEEILKTSQVLKQIVGYEPRLFRAPLGKLNGNLVESLGELNYFVVGWSVDSHDWTTKSVYQITTNVVSSIHPGAIILMHGGDYGGVDLSYSIKALDQIIPQLKEKGMNFVTVSELLHISDQREGISLP